MLRNLLKTLDLSEELSDGEREEGDDDGEEPESGDQDGEEGNEGQEGQEQANEDQRGEGEEGETAEILAGRASGPVRRRCRRRGNGGRARAVAAQLQRAR